MSDYQLSFDDLAFQQYVNDQPGRVAFIDESGSYGFNFETAGNSKYYVVCAIIVENDKLARLHADVEKIKRENGYGNTEIKSSSINDIRRFRIMGQMLSLDFRVAILIADKEKFAHDSPLTKYKETFIKHLDQRLYDLLYRAYPKLKIIQDETGWPEFQESFKNYVANHHDYNFFNDYDFELVNSKDETLVQVADFIGGSISKSLRDPNLTNYLEMLRGKIVALERFPHEFEPYWGRLNPEDCKYDETIFSLAEKTVRDFISKYGKDNDEDRKLQVAVLQYLQTYVLEIDPTRYVYADELVEHLRDRFSKRITRNNVFRRVIAPIRDAGVILASCKKGYKIPISADDLMVYLNQSLITVGPMVHRMGICRNIVKQATDNRLDLFDDPALIRFKRYFDENI